MDTLCVLGIMTAVLAAVGLFAISLFSTPGKDNINTDMFGVSSDYADTLFDRSYVHTINVIVSDLNWNYMVEHAKDEVYVLCDAIIDGDLIENIALRPKGNSSLASIESQGSEHFSFKIEFDHYRKGNTFHGLDKLSLNNLSSDTTCMKDYFSYRIHQEADAISPLADYTTLLVNGRDFGFYLAVEAVEDSFVFRNYGSESGQLYKPEPYEINTVFSTISASEDEDNRDLLAAFDGAPGEHIEILAEILNTAFAAKRDAQEVASVKYVGNSTRLYSTIFNTAVFDLNEEQKASYIGAVKTLNSSENPLDALDLENVIRYFAAHNFVSNYDSYTGSAIHNFYIREYDGRLSLIPWDYNLSFGAFTIDGAFESILGGTEYDVQMNYGAALTADESAINYPIDEPIQVVGNEERPMFGAWISDPSAHEYYYSVYRDLLDDYFLNGRFEEEYEKVYAMIYPFVEQGMTFYPLDQFEKGAEQILKYCLLRSKSIDGQIKGFIPADKKGQMEHPEALLSVGDLNLGLTVDFSGLVMGITKTDILAVLNAVTDDADEEHTIEGIGRAIQKMTANPARLPGIAAHALSESSFFQHAVYTIVMPYFLMLLSVLAMWFGLLRIKKMSRR